jgi:hypothetical protein
VAGEPSSGMGGFHFRQRRGTRAAARMRIATMLSYRVCLSRFARAGCGYHGRAAVVVGDEPLAEIWRAHHMRASIWGVPQ